MLSFIGSIVKKFNGTEDLNTSHVIFYLPNCIPAAVALISFKYISCYLLSCLAPTQVHRYGYLNTSHVIFYLGSINPYPEEVLNLNTSHVIFYPAGDCKCGRLGRI